MARYLLDTNVLLRAVHKTAAQHPLAVKALASLAARGESLCLTGQILVEFWAVATRPIEANGFGWEPDLAEAEIERLLNEFALLEETPAIFTHWLQLVTSQHVLGKKVHDARLIAVMQAHGTTHLLTFNREDFVRYSGIVLVHPSEVI
jgi:predicted nucleic acid-binding protein